MTVKTSLKEERLLKWVQKALFYTRKERITRVSPKPGDIYAVDMGENIGSEINGIRPCVVISGTKYNLRSGTFTIIPITGHDEALPGQLLITDDLLDEGQVRGVIKIEMITTVSRGRVGNYIGRLNLKGRSQLATKLYRFFSPLHRQTFKLLTIGNSSLGQ